MRGEKKRVSTATTCNYRLKVSVKLHGLSAMHFRKIMIILSLSVGLKLNINFQEEHALFWRFMATTYI